MIGLTAFQRDIIRLLYHEGEMIGLELKNKMQDDRDENVNHGRLYPNLNSLVDEGYIEKRDRDGRSNFYSLTDEGKGVFENYRQKVHVG